MVGTVDLDRLALFVAVAEAGSFSGAARRLGLPKSSVSRGLARLEAELGATLVHRTTRRVALSTAGAALLARVKAPLAALGEAVGSLPEREEQPSGELKLTAPVDLGATFLAALGARFVARYPGVRLDARLTNRSVDLVAEGFDVALRAVSGRLADSSLVVRRVAALDAQLYAAPTYLARRGAPRSIDDALAEHDWVVFRGGRRVSPEVAPERVRLYGDDYFFVRSAVSAGAGLGILPAYLAQDEVAAGTLVRVLPRWAQTAGALVLVHPRMRQLPRKVTAFRDFLLEHLAAHPLSPRPP